jgi:hypothetical protein
MMALNINVTYRKENPQKCKWTDVQDFQEKLGLLELFFEMRSAFLELNVWTKGRERNASFLRVHFVHIVLTTLNTVLSEKG